MPDSLRLAVFDVDGTLIDSQANIVAANRMAFSRAGLPVPTDEAIHHIIGMSLVPAIAEMLPEGQKHRAEEIAEGYKQAYLEIIARPDYDDPLFPGAAEELDRLEAEGWLLAVATSKSRRGADRFIARHGWEGRFIDVQTPDTALGKPNPEMLENIMRKTGADAANTVMIGDTRYDIEMAHNARTKSIGVSWGNHAREVLIEARASVVIDSFAEMRSALHRLWGGQGHG